MESHTTTHPCGPLVSRRTFLAAAASSTLLVSRGRAGENQCPAARAVTRGPRHHWFGYYDKCPWDKTGRYLLVMENNFCDRQPNPGEQITIGMVDLKNGDRFIPLDTTPAWSWQQGTMLQWLGSAPDREIIYNSVEDGQYIAVIRDVHSGKTRRIPRPIYAVSPDGKQAVTLNFDRLHRLRPGYGYCALPEKHADVAAPKDYGISWMNIATGEHKLIIPIAWAAENKPDDRFKDAHHWFNHLQFNPSGTRFCFLHRWAVPGKPWATRFYTAKPDGSDVCLICDSGMVSHFDWRDDTTLLAWARTKEKGDHFYLFDARTGEAKVVGEGVLTRDGHCNYSPDRRWFLNDTYPDKERMQTLMVVRTADEKRIDIGKFYMPPKFTGPWRCDLHPRWNRDGTQVCVDAVENETRQVFVVDVSRVVNA